MGGCKGEEGFFVGLIFSLSLDALDGDGISCLSFDGDTRSLVGDETFEAMLREKGPSFISRSSLP